MYKLVVLVESEGRPVREASDAEIAQVRQAFGQIPHLENILDFTSEDGGEAVDQLMTIEHNLSLAGDPCVLADGVVAVEGPDGKTEESTIYLGAV